MVFYWASFTLKKLFPNFTWLYLGEAVSATKVTPQGGPHTHNNPHQQRALLTAAWPFLNQQKLFLKLGMEFQFMICINISSVNWPEIEIFHEFNNFIKEFKTVGKYFLVSSLKTDSHLIHVWTVTRQMTVNNLVSSV